MYRFGSIEFRGRNRIGICMYGGLVCPNNSMRLNGVFKEHYMQYAVN